MWVTAYVDASWCPKTKAAGWAVWLRCNQGREVLSGSFTCKSSLEAEVVAAILGVKLAVEKFPNAEAVLIKTDCDGAQKMLQFEGKRPRSERLCMMQEKLVEFREAHDIWVKVRWTKGHDPGNEAPAYINRRVDRLARIQMKKAREVLR